MPAKPIVWTKDERGNMTTAYPPETMYIATIPAVWGNTSPYIQTVNITGITADISPIVDIILPDDINAAIAIIEAWNLVGRIKTNDGNITVICYNDRPTVDIPIQIKVVV